MITVLEQWKIIDNWWKNWDERINDHWAEVDWEGRKILFRRREPDPVWRIFKPNLKEKTCKIISPNATRLANSAESESKRAYRLSRPKRK
jgi:hypothetical protein